jgi:hypothetical protein
MSSGSEARRPRLGLLAALLLGACGVNPEPLAPAPNRYAHHLDGDDDVVELGTIGTGSPLLLAGSPFTVAAWFRQREGGDLYQRIIDKSDDVMGHNGWGLGLDPDIRMIHFYVHDGSRGADFASARGAYEMDRWHQVVAVARRDRLEIWVDGKPHQGTWYEGGAFTLPAAVATAARLGSWNHAGEREWKGWIDEVAVWSTDLPGPAIAALHAARGRADLRANRGAYQAAGRLVAHWRMGDGPENGAGPVIFDVSESGPHGSLGPEAAAGNRPTFDATTLP